MYTCEADFTRGWQDAETQRERVAIATKALAFIAPRIPDYADPLWGLYMARYDLWRDRALGWCGDERKYQ